MVDRKAFRATEKRIQHDLRFVGSQDGPVEDRLKATLADLFAQNGPVDRAYLARVTYGANTETSVALCIRSSRPHDERLVSQVGLRFSVLFNNLTHMDILFLSREQEREVAAVCDPFYMREGSGPSTS